MDNTYRKLARFLSSAYDFSEPVSLHPIEGGDWNQVYRIDGKGEWILRVSHCRKTEEQLRFELTIVSLLSECLSYVPKIRLSREGKLYARFEGKMCALFEFKPGRSLTITNDTVILAGATLGEIHNEHSNISQKHRLVTDLSIIRFDWLNNYFYSGDILDAEAREFQVPDEDRMFLEDIFAHMDFLRSVRARLRQWLDRCRERKLFAESITHGDFCRRNILTESGHVTAVLDWDETVTSWLEYEVATALWEFSRDDSRFVMIESRQALFLDAYSSAHSLPSLDGELLLRFIAVRRLIEIQLGLFELANGRECDLKYCHLNLRNLQNLDLNS